MKQCNSRAVAAIVLLQVLQYRRDLNSAFVQQAAILSQLSLQDQSWVKAACFGVLRRLDALKAMLNPLLQRPIKSKERVVEVLLLLGIYQLWQMQAPEHATVSETVNAVRQLNKPWAVKLVNACLRQWLRQKDDLLEGLSAQQKSGHPAWLLKRLKRAWPDHWQHIIAANQQQAPMILRVNQQHTTREAYRQLLLDAGIVARPVASAPMALVLAHAVDVKKLPHFVEGWASVQDLSAQYAAGLLGLSSGMRVLDACAAPGGKTAHIGELQPGLVDLVAIDSEPTRVERLQETLDRCQVAATVICADAAEVDDWWDGQRFDRILLDAPCSATGVLRRHPDIAYLRRQTDIEALARQQQRLLQQLLPLLAPGGRLLYVTCSVLPEENQRQMQWLQKTLTAYQVRPCLIEADNAIMTDIGTQLLPDPHGGDGFFYAIVEHVNGNEVTADS